MTERKRETAHENVRKITRNTRKKLKEKCYFIEERKTSTRKTHTKF